MKKKKNSENESKTFDQSESRIQPRFGRGIITTTNPERSFFRSYRIFQIKTKTLLLFC